MSTLSFLFSLSALGSFFFVPRLPAQRFDLCHRRGRNTAAGSLFSTGPGPLTVFVAMCCC